ncbi:hemerythrin domain-containing protein [Lysobacter sp. GX 14042]|uniref:hemerythrin domain-containing protein n=1 Tax=Lysobacter sp. GX 14042 TaxID=2907155 RepID=UPI001F2A27BB|nr:hemerythrin domain-containing protein [Lysobacter sp. GX 14042]MCE7032031.1 hemerythrin domain-containing protein [Lysobacter sp. GX 14042]
MDIQRYTNAHVEILGQIDALRTLIGAGIAEQSGAIASLLVNIASGIKFHLAAEDRVLYPAFAASQDPGAMALGRRYQDEMQGLSADFAELVLKWRVGPRIAADPEGFRAHANAVFKALFERLTREERELYPMAERL